jgi:hypothetical protein
MEQNVNTCIVHIEQIIQRVLAEARDVKTAAAYNGNMTDGGADVLEAQVRFYRYGRNGVVPPEWQKYADQVRKEADPEYEQYKKLKMKFEG